MRRPRNPVGWGLSGYGLSFSLGVLAEEHARRASTSPLPYAELAAWYQTWSWALALLLVVAGFVSLVVRHRRSGPVERLQLRWLFTATAGLAAGMLGFLASGGPTGAPQDATAK